MKQPAQILMVDDSESDAHLVEEALDQHTMAVRLLWMEKGQDALRHLHRQLQDPDGRLPELILLDLNLPGMSGWEVLQELKKDPALRRIPVLVFTSSSLPRDINRAYSLDANCYLIKPIDWDPYRDLIHSVAEFWLGTAILAPAKRSYRLTALQGAA